MVEGGRCSNSPGWRWTEDCQKRSARLLFQCEQKVFSDGNGTISWERMEEVAEPMGKGRENGEAWGDSWRSIFHREDSWWTATHKSK